MHLMSLGDITPCSNDGNYFSVVIFERREFFFYKSPFFVFIHMDSQTDSFVIIFTMYKSVKGVEKYLLVSWMDCLQLFFHASSSCWNVIPLYIVEHIFFYIISEDFDVSCMNSQSQTSVLVSQLLLCLCDIIPKYS